MAEIKSPALFGIPNTARNIIRYNKMKNIPDFSVTAKKIKELSRVTADAVPSKQTVISIVEDMRIILFPEYFPEFGIVDTEAKLSELYLKLCEQISASMRFSGKSDADTDSVAKEITEFLPSIKEMLLKDVVAIYEGDPAAVSPEEVILSYPGFFAITIYRIAHEFYKRKIPLLPRLMTEYVHEKTGIDIHAGAEIGEYFFIDHGTGIVVGETTTIGDRVKIYQGVTLGARSFELDADGNPVKGVKRHPDIGNNVIIYANATILGGNTRIGDNAIIGANVWLTHSVEDGAKVYYNN